MMSDNPRIEEKTLYEPIIRYLRDIGFDAIGESSVTTKHPDILFKVNSTSFVIEVKIGSSDVGLKAVAQASDYAKRLGTDNIVILIYPEKYRNQVITDLKIVEKIALESEVDCLLLTEYLTKSLKESPTNIFNVLKSSILQRKAIIDFNTIVNLIGGYVIELNSIIYQARTDKLVSEVVDKLDLFCSIGEIKDKQTASNQIINLASYLLFNQLLFYHICESKTKTNLDELCEITHIIELQDYFNSITKIDYQPIYKINILGNIPDNLTTINTLNEVIKSIKLLRAEHITHDLAGRFFSDLIPFEVRKVLAAFYTHPVAGEILAGLTIDSWDKTVMDPACGSGTLLVSSYKRKLELYSKLYGFKALSDVHKRFLENDITGIDIMPFAGHIATLNLTTQSIEQETNKVRIAAMDSLSLSSKLLDSYFIDKGVEIYPFTKQIQDRLFQVADSNVEVQDLEGALSPMGVGEGFKMKPVDIVIMNPPFSDREKMPEDMRDKLKKNRAITSICGNRVNLWGFFLALSDLLLKPNGKIGAVIPINIARGKATEEIRNYLLANYSIKYIIKSVVDLAFSEGAAFRDILLIAEKRKAKIDDLTGIVFLKKSIRKMKLDEADKIITAIMNSPHRIGTRSYNDFDIVFVTYSELLELRDNLMPILGVSFVSNIEIFSKFFKLLEKYGQNKITNLGKFNIAEGFHASPAGLSQLTFITRPIEEERLSRAFLIMEKEDNDYVTSAPKNTDIVFNISKDNLLPAIRTLTNVKSFYVGKNKDYFIKDEFDGFDTLLTLSKWKSDDFDWNNVRDEIKDKETYLALARRFNPTTDNTHFFAFYSEDKFIAPDTFKVIQTTKEEAKFQCLFLNSIIGLISIVSLREQTTGKFTDIRETELVLFNAINSGALSQKEIETLNNIFEKLKGVEFPSIVEQLESRFWARVELDSTILKILGFSKDEINEWIPKVYGALAKELKAL